MADRRPNLILINCDDLGYGDLGCYGSPVNQSPTLDRLAAEGMRFTDFTMASSVCSPSRGAMMTGCYPRRIGFGSFEGRWVLFPGQGVGLNPDETTLASLLKQQGYATQIVGKWHCGDQPEFLPTRHGFDGYYGIPYSNDMGRQAGPPKDYPPLPLLLDEDVIEAQPDQASLTERYVEQCVRFMRQHQDEPFFLYLAHMYVHLPIYAPPHLLADSKNGPFGAAVRCVDWSVAVLVQELERLGLAEDTLIVFTSDNGARGDHGGSNGPLNGRKGTRWEGGFRVPCIAYWPGTIPAGVECREMASSIDLLPTFAALAGAELPQRPIDGVDLGPLLRGETGQSPRETFFYYLSDTLAAVRAGRWKLHVSDGKQPVTELYDLVDDIGETTNLANEHLDVVERLQALLAECREELGDALQGVEGRACRPIGQVSDPAPLTEYDPEHPYYMAMYDLADRG